MHFDLFYELSVPSFAHRSESTVFHETLEELAVAEQCGFRTAWLVEHHFMKGYSHSSAPDLLLAAASQRTRTLRLGHAVVPLPYHHPLHVAERIATLDVLSQGRVDFGFGRGFDPREYAAFGIDMAHSRELVEESLAILRASFIGAPIRFHGKHFHIDDIEVVPKIAQQPHPPLWMAAVSPESFTLAARLGVSVLVGPFKPWFMVREDIARYRAAWAEYGHGTPARVAMTVGIVCLEDGARAREIAKQNLTWFYRELLQRTAPVLEKLHASYEYYRRVGSFRALLPATINLTVLETLGMAVAGDPDHCRQKLETYRDAGVDRLLCAIGAGGCASADTRAVMQTLHRHTMPAFAESACAS